MKFIKTPLKHMYHYGYIGLVTNLPSLLLLIIFCFKIGIKIAFKLEDTQAFKSIGAKMSRRIHPHCSQYEWGTDEYWKCFVEQDTLPMIHPTSTCKMGSVDKPDTVVNPRLK